jgi:hypothetical protein
MKRGWVILGIFVPVMALITSGCLTAGAQQFNASAIVAGATGPVIVNFSYDVRDGKNRIRGHVRDANLNPMFPKGVFLKLHGVLAPFMEGPDVNCMGALVRYIVEDPDHPYSGPLVDDNNNPLLPNEGQLFIDACDNNKDDMASLADTFDIQVIDGPLAGYSNAGTVIKGNFECQFPQICQPV